MKTQLLRRAAVLLSLLALVSGTVRADSLRMDGLLVSSGPSPCLAVKVRVFHGDDQGTPGSGLLSGPLSELTVGQKGVVKVTGGAAPVFTRGQSFRLQGSCVGGGVGSGDSAQSSALTFTADGRTVMLVFTDAGFQFKRGGVAY